MDSNCRRQYWQWTRVRTARAPVSHTRTSDIRTWSDNGRLHARTHARWWRRWQDSQVDQVECYIVTREPTCSRSVQRPWWTKCNMYSDSGVAHVGVSTQALRSLLFTFVFNECSVILSFAEKGISDIAMLAGDCISRPCGFLSSFLSFSSLLSFLLCLFSFLWA